MFGEDVDEVETFSVARPSAAYLERLLGSESFIGLAAVRDGEVVGGLAAKRRDVLHFDIPVTRE